MAKATKKQAEESTAQAEDETAPDNIQNAPEEGLIGDNNLLDDLDMGFKLPADLQATLEHDPFAGNMEGDPEPEKAEEKKESEQAAGDSDSPSDKDIQSKSDSEKLIPDPQPGSQETAPKPATPAVSDPKDTQIENLLAQVTNLTTQMTNMQAAAAPAAAEAGEVKGPNFVREIPDQMINLMNSEDPAERKQGLSALVNGVGVMIHEQVMKDVDIRLASVKTDTESSVARNSEVQATYRDFYDTFPQLDNEAFRPMVAAESQAVFKELGVTAWSPAVRDAIGTRVIKRLQEFNAPAAASADENGNGEGAPSQNPAPASLKDGGTRPASAVGTSVEADIESTIFG